MGGFVTNQVISDEQSTEGNQSFKTTTETAFVPQQNQIVGGFYTYASPVNYTDAEISFDFYIDEVANGNDYLFGIAGEDSAGTEGYVTFVNFNFQNNIKVPDDMGFTTIVGDWITNTWYNIRIEITNAQAEYFIDDVSVGTYNLVNNYDLLSARIIHDNYGGSAYFDNFRTNDEPLSSFDLDTVSFNYFVDAENNLHLSANLNFNQVKLHNLLGQQVISQKLSSRNESIDLNALTSGVYLAQVQINHAVKTFKIVKK